MTEISKTSYKALRIVIILNLLIGVQYCWSVISPACTAKFGWTPTQATLPYTVLTVTNALAAIPLGLWGEKHGPNKVIFLGGICVGCGILLCSVSQSLAGMIFGYGLVTSFGLAAISMNTTPTSMKWFPAGKKGLVTGASTMCIGFSPLYMAPLIEGLLGRLGLNQGLRILGIGAALLICLFSLALPPPPNLDRNREEVRAVPEDNSRYHGRIEPGQVAKTREFWLLLALYAISWMPGQMIFSSVSTICQVQAGWDKGYIAVMAMSLGNGAGRLLGSALTDKIGGIRTMTLLLITQMVNLLFFAFYRTPAVIVPGIVILGFCVGAGVSLLMILIANIYGMKYVGSIYAILQLGYAISGVIGPQVAARILEFSGTYTVAYYVNAAFLLLGLFCVSALKRKK
ncbi:MAG: OFA family MFS transporter [Clostridium sp.]|nr:OFA family MFS transporter [Clostridium sp.]